VLLYMLHEDVESWVIKSVNAHLVTPKVLILRDA
jgi:hypothetical protein